MFWKTMFCIGAQSVSVSTLWFSQYNDSNNKTVILSETSIKNIMGAHSWELLLFSRIEMTPSMIPGENSDAQFNLLLQLSSDRDIFPLHPFLIISSVSMSEAECERVGSCSLDPPPSLSFSQYVHISMVFFYGCGGGQLPRCCLSTCRSERLHSIFNH